MLRQRIITGVVLLLGVILAVSLMTRLEFGIVSALAILVAAWEWVALVELVSVVARVVYMAFIVLIMLVCANWVNELYVLVGALCFLLWLIVEVYCYAKGRRTWLLASAPGCAVVGIILFVVCWFGFNVLFAAEYGRAWVLYTIAVIASVDTAGYFIGRRFGRHFLCVRVSPKKTWEGFFAGVLAAVPLSLVGAWALHLHFIHGLLLCLGSMIATVFALYGDLIESVVKRRAGVKDSGHLLPGHGGVLDRIDSMLACVPIFALLMWILASI